MWLREKTKLVNKCFLLSVCVSVVFYGIGNVECRKSGGRSRTSTGGRSKSTFFSWFTSKPSSSNHPSPSYHPSASYSSPSPSYTYPSPASLSDPPSWHPKSYEFNRHAWSVPDFDLGPQVPIGSHSSSGANKPIGPQNAKPVDVSFIYESTLKDISKLGFKFPMYGSRMSPSKDTHSSSGANKPIGTENVKPVGASSGVAAPPTYGFNTHASNPPAIGFKPSVTHDAGSISKPAAPSNSFKPSAPPAEHATVSKPVGSANAGTSQGNPPPYGFKPSAPVGPPTNAKPVGNVPPGAPFAISPPAYSPHNPGIPPPAYNPAHNPAGYGPPPAYNPTYVQNGAYPQQQYHQGGYGYSGYSNQDYGGTPGYMNINNININTHHYAGGGGAFGYNYPVYHYSSNDVGSDTLGFFLGHSLGKLTTPTFHSHPSFYDGYTPRYDHYEVHHYYHNRDSIPAQSTIQPNTIVGCVGDSGSICPTGTTSLCTNNGNILCVTSASNMVPCSDSKQGNCVQTVVLCVNGTGDCEVGQNRIMSIPCISKALVPGNITYVNNTIIVNHTTIINNNTTRNSTTVSTASGALNGTTSLDSALSAISNATAEVPTTLAPNITSDGTRSKRETPAVPINDFCVTILALPVERKPTEQEQLFDKGTNIFTKMLAKALGANRT